MPLAVSISNNESENSRHFTFPGKKGDAYLIYWPKTSALSVFISGCEFFYLINSSCCGNAEGIHEDHTGVAFFSP